MEGTTETREERMRRHIREARKANRSSKRDIRRALILLAQVLYAGAVAGVFFWLMLPTSSFLDGGWQTACAAVIAIGMFVVGIRSLRGL